MRIISCIALIACATTIASAQTLYVPSGTSGIGTAINPGIGVGTNAPLGQLETVTANRRVSLNGTVQNAAVGGLVTLSRASDGGMAFLMGVVDGAGNDNVLCGLGSSNEMRFVSGSSASQGFSFYLNQIGSQAFGVTRPTPVARIDGSGNMGLGVLNPFARLHVVGTGSSNIDVRVNGRIMTGDGNANGGVWLNSLSTMMVGQSGATSVGLYNNSAWRFVVNSNGNTGIGATNPAQLLHLAGTTNAYIRFDRASGADESGLQFTNAGTTKFYMFMDNNSDGIKFRAEGLSGEVDATPRLELPGTTKDIYMVSSGGKVGIGTSAPDEKLSVKGKIHTQEIKVDMLGSMAPDYVFEIDYALPSLEKVEAYINQHHHLPEVPSAAEMETDGIELKEMNLLLLKKVEELTLYVIELKKENERQNAVITELKPSNKKRDKK